MARLLRYLGVAVLLLALIGGGIYAGLLYFARPGEHLAGVSGDDQKGLLAAAIENVLSTPGMKISIGAVDGPLSSDAVIRDVVISDEQGPWLRLDRARIIWTRSALLLGQLIVRNLEIGHLAAAAAAHPSGDARGRVSRRRALLRLLGSEPADQGRDRRLFPRPARPRRGRHRRRSAARREGPRQPRPPLRRSRSRLRPETAGRARRTRPESFL